MSQREFTFRKEKVKVEVEVQLAMASVMMTGRPEYAYLPSTISNFRSRLLLFNDGGADELILKPCEHVLHYM